MSVSVSVLCVVCGVCVVCVVRMIHDTASLSWRVRTMHVIRVAEHLGASSRRPRHPFPALMAGEPPGRVPVYTVLKSHPINPRRAENCNCGKPQFSARLDPMPCHHNNGHVTTVQELHLCTLHLDGLVTEQIHLPLLTATFVLQLETGKDVVVWANFVIAAEPAIQHANTPNVLLVLEIIEDVFSSNRTHAVPNRIISTMRSERHTTTRHRDANTSAAHWGRRARAICRRRARGHDISSGNDGTTIQRDCERHQSVSRRMPVIRLAPPRQNSQGRHVHGGHAEGQESHLVLAVLLLGLGFLLLFFFFLLGVEEEDEEPGRDHRVALVWGFQK